MYLATCSTSHIVKAIEQLGYKKGMSAMLLVAEQETMHVPAIIDTLNKQNIHFFGGIFPGLIYHKKRYSEGIIILVFPMVYPAFLIENLHQEDQIKLPAFYNLINSTMTKYLSIILVDGLSANIAFFLSELHGHLGQNVSFFGGGAGSSSLEQSPCIFNNQGCFQDAALVAFIDLTAELSISHGWQYLSGPFIATKTDRNIIKELNWQNAYEVYSNTINQYSEEKINMVNFFNIAQKFPFGIYQDANNNTVRDPIAVNDRQELVCVGEVPQNTILNILYGTQESLIMAVEHSIKGCFQKSNGTIKHGLTMSCLSRMFFLKNNYQDELATINDNITTNNPDIVLEGAITLGEIAANNMGILEFFNKTVVTSIISNYNNNEE